MQAYHGGARRGRGWTIVHDMRVAVRELFCELANVSPEERERILSERNLPESIRAEVESLLRHDSEAEAFLARRVSGAAEAALRARYCGPYRLIELLGTGGMGSVYLAERRDGEIEQKVAIKLLRSDSSLPAWRDHFLIERQRLADLDHPAIARLLDAGHTADRRPYLVMEYVDGVTIDQYAERLDLRARLRLFLRVCSGVSHAHRHLIIHRDLKPSNILVDSSGQPKLLDFGIAKLLDAPMDSTAADIYSLGAVLHRVLTGPQETKLPRDIEFVLRKALHDEPEERYASVDAFADDIRAFLANFPSESRLSD